MRSSDAWLRVFTGSWGTLAALALLGAAATPGVARTWLVDDDRAECPTADFVAIGPAVAAAASGDTLRLCSGLYRENVTVLNKSLTFQGDGTDRVIVDGNPAQPSGTAASSVSVFTLRATNGKAFVCSFSGLTVRRGKYGIWAQDTETSGGTAGSNMTVNVSKCVFIQNGYDGLPYVSQGSSISADYTTHATDGGAIRGEGDDSKVTDSQFLENDRAIEFDFGRRLLISGNEIGGNVQAGISVGQRRAQGAAPAVTDVTIRGNQVRDNFDAGIRISGGLRVTVEGNSVERNWSSGIVAYDGDTVTVHQNRVVENSRLDINGVGSFTPDAFGGVVIIEPVGPVTVDGNDIRSNHTGLFTHTAGGVRLVKSRNVAVTLTGNTLVANDGDGVAIENNGASVHINGNNITSNRGFGVNNLGSATVDAARNWWASAKGPRGAPANADNPEQVSGRLVTQPWVTTPFTYPDIQVTPSP
jgi:nitrous oxidase accessory protein NosD